MSQTSALVSVDNVHTARKFYVRHGINPARLFDYESFQAADDETLDRIPAVSQEYFTARWLLEQHFRPKPPGCHRVSYRFMKLNNVYRLRDLWRDVPQ